MVAGSQAACAPIFRTAATLLFRNAARGSKSGEDLGLKRKVPIAHFPVFSNCIMDGNGVVILGGHFTQEAGFSDVKLVKLFKHGLQAVYVAPSENVGVAADRRPGSVKLLFERRQTVDRRALPKRFGLLLQRHQGLPNLIVSGR